MSDGDIDQLLEELTRPRAEPEEAPAPTSASGGGGRAKGRGVWLAGAAVVAALGVLAAMAVVAVSGGGGRSPEAVGRDTAAPTSTSSATSSSTSGTAPVAAGPGPTGAPATATTVAAITPAGRPGQATDDNPSGAIRWVVVQDHQLHLRGFTPNQALADQIAGMSRLLWGGDNFSNEMMVDPSVPADTPTAVYIRDLVLFDFNSAVIKPDYVYILDAGAKFLLAAPNIRVRVIARTDATGTPAQNLRIATRRAQAVVDYYARAGVGPDRFVLDPRGEAEAELGADATTAARDRNVEFEVLGTIGV